MRIAAVSRHPWRGQRRPGALAGAATLTALAAALAAASPPAQAALGQRPGAGTPDKISSLTTLNGVSADSATNAWAAGYYDSSKSSDSGVPLTERWNGTAWKTVKSPAPSGATYIVLHGVSAVSATDAWTAGSYENSSGVSVPLILHWNGTAWTTVKSPTPSGAGVTTLAGLSAVSAADAWVVGYYETSGVFEPLTEHWNGTAWKEVTAPVPSGATYPGLSAVSAVSATNAWAVGSYQNSSGTDMPLTEHWNGTAWKTVTSPAPSGAVTTILSGVSAVSATDAWAVGCYNTIDSTPVPLIEHWNGTAWKTVKSPTPSGATDITPSGVSAVSATDAWTVGSYQNGSGTEVPLILHWNGTAWSQVASPAPSGATNTSLTGVSTVSATDAWAAGSYDIASGVSESLILRWNGTAWKKVTSPNGP
jgi:hypothetical protein